MNFNRHSTLVGHHAFLSASKYSWINYDEDKLEKAYNTAQAAQRGNELHAYAAEAIRLGIKQVDCGKTLNLYINDCIGFRMSPEQILFYSDNAFGCADAIGFRANVLRVSDFKSGVSPTSEHQLEIYAAMFCLEYHVNPFNLDAIELRIYQLDEVRLYDGDPDVIFHIMEKMKTFDRIINTMRLEAL